MTGFSKQIVVAGALSLLGSSVHAAVLLQTDFNSTTTGAYANNSVINSGAPTTDDLNVRVGTDAIVAVVDLGGGNRALQFTDNNNTTGGPVVFSRFSGVSSDGTGDNQITGSVTVTRLSDKNFATNFGINGNNSATFDGNNTAVQVLIENGIIKYLNGTTGTVSSGVAMTVGTQYRFDIFADFSSDTQDKWSLTVTDLGSDTVVVSSGLINTRAANVTPNVISFRGLANNADPSLFMQFDNMNFTSIPEPASMGLLGLGSLLIGRRARPAVSYSETR